MFQCFKQSKLTNQNVLIKYKHEFTVTVFERTNLHVI